MYHQDDTDTPNAIVRSAFERDPYAFRRICSLRAGASPERSGACFPRRSPEQVEAMMGAVMWEPYTHTRVKPPRQAFVATHIPGRMGVAHVEDLPDSADLVASSSPVTVYHPGPRVYRVGPETGLARIVWLASPAESGHRTTFVVAIVERDGVGYSLVDLFPGDPMEPTAFPLDRASIPAKLTPQRVRDIGVEWVEVRPVALDRVS